MVDEWKRKNQYKKCMKYLNMCWCWWWWWLWWWWETKHTIAFCLTVVTWIIKDSSVAAKTDVAYIYLQTYLILCRFIHLPKNISQHNIVLLTLELLNYMSAVVTPLLFIGLRVKILHAIFRIFTLTVCVVVELNCITQEVVFCYLFIRHSLM